MTKAQDRLALAEGFGQTLPDHHKATAILSKRVRGDRSLYDGILSESSMDAQTRKLLSADSGLSLEDIAKRHPAKHWSKRRKLLNTSDFVGKADMDDPSQHTSDLEKEAGKQIGRTVESGVKGAVKFVANTAANSTINASDFVGRADIDDPSQHTSDLEKEAGKQIGRTVESGVKAIAKNVSTVATTANRDLNPLPPFSSLKYLFTGDDSNQEYKTQQAALKVRNSSRIYQNPNSRTESKAEETSEPTTAPPVTEPEPVADPAEQEQVPQTAPGPEQPPEEVPEEDYGDQEEQDLEQEQDCRNGRNLLSNEECSDEELVAQGKNALTGAQSAWNALVKEYDHLGGEIRSEDMAMFNSSNEQFSELDPKDLEDYAEGLQGLVNKYEAGLGDIEAEHARLERKPELIPYGQNLGHAFAKLRNRMVELGLPLDQTLTQFRANGENRTRKQMILRKMSDDIATKVTENERNRLHNSQAPAFTTNEERFKQTAAPNLQTAFGAMVTSGAMRFGSLAGMALATSYGANPATAYAVGLGLNSLAGVVLESTDGDVRRGQLAMEGIADAITQRSNPILAAKQAVERLSSTGAGGQTPNAVVSIFAQAARQTSQMETEKQAFTAWANQMRVPFAI